MKEVSVIATALGGTDRSGVYIGSAECNAIALKLGYDIDTCSPEVMLAVISERAAKDAKTKELALLIKEIVQKRIDEYLGLKSLCVHMPCDFLQAAERTIKTMEAAANV